MFESIYHSLIEQVPPHMLLLALGVALFAGFIKGVVGFAMPLIMVSLFSGFLSSDMALAGMILPTITANLTQALGGGFRAALQNIWEYRRFITATMVFIAVSAPLFNLIEPVSYLLVLGIPVTAYALLQLIGVPLQLNLRQRNISEWILGIIGGFYGGISGIWGPPLLVLLLSTHVEKLKMIRVQGVVFLIGSVVLLASHLNTGVLDNNGLTFSALMIIPAQIGMFIGQRLQHHISQEKFRRAAQILLVITGANLIKKALFLYLD